ncbi:MAG TPA: glycoside hydrolase domain-containing protein [Bryobacteraceae bacterium]|nr:glycoside hydrolase domain-containing protein [Bryobacteraceae bacterium]
MKLKNWRFGTILSAFVFAAAALAAQPVIWVAPSMHRVMQRDPAGAVGLAQIRAARGEYESFQIVVTAPPGGLSGVNVTVSNLNGPGGAVIPRTDLALFREHYVNVVESSPNWGGSNQPLGAGNYPDALIPFIDPATGQPPAAAALRAVPFNLDPGMNQPIWVDISVPRNIPAGQYNGTFTVTSNQGYAWGSISLQVWNFDLPETPALHSAFLFWNGEGLAADEELLRNKINPLRTGTEDESNLMSHFGLDSVALPFWSGADVSTCSMNPAPSTADFQNAAAQQQPGLLKFVYSADEIGNCGNLYGVMQQWASNMHRAGLKNLVTMAPNPNLYDDGSGTGQSAVDIWTMLPIGYDADPSAVQYVLRKGDSAWSYNTMVQDAYSPKWELDFSPVDFRIQPGFINQSLGLSGLLYWRVDMWSSDPWNDINTIGVWNSSNYPGEGVLVYPGEQVGIQGVAPSMRLKWLRDGVEDYDYVNILKKLGQGDWALQVVRSVGADWSHWTQDPNALQAARDQLGARIDALSTTR